MKLSFPQTLDQLKRVPLHPISVREIKKGNPWITADQFSKRFPANQFFLIGRDQNRREICVFLHDPSHPKIKGRVWSHYPFQASHVTNFPEELFERLRKSIQRRLESGVQEERDNFYLVFGESDQLPGLFIQKIGEQVLIQLYATFWNQLQDLLFQQLKTVLKDFFPKEYIELWLQERGNPKQPKMVNVANINGSSKKKNQNIVIQEFGINYLVSFQKNYDLGIYTDMSSIRKKLTSLFQQGTSVLNLYAYTGAFSLFALKQGATRVVSVDLSPKYMEWLEKNMGLNPELKFSRHQGIVKPTNKAVRELQESGEEFDLVICDPPSASSDGKKTSSSFQNYQELLPKLINVTKSGGYVLAFLNTHQISLQKFRNQVKKILQTNNLDRSVVENRTIGLGEDCPTLKGFREGSYLKGILLQKKR